MSRSFKDLICEQLKDPEFYQAYKEVYKEELVNIHIPHKECYDMDKCIRCVWFLTIGCSEWNEIKDSNEY